MVMIGMRAGILVANACSSAGPCDPSKAPEYLAKAWDEVGGVLRVVGLDQVIIGFCGLLRAIVGHHYLRLAMLQICAPRVVGVVS